jgi:hypothetical protein
MENGATTKLYHNRGATPGLRVKIEEVHRIPQASERSCVFRFQAE